MYNNIKPEDRIQVCFYRPTYAHKYDMLYRTNRISWSHSNNNIWFD